MDPHSKPRPDQSRRVVLKSTALALFPFAIPFSTHALPETASTGVPHTYIDASRPLAKSYSCSQGTAAPVYEKPT